MEITRNIWVIAFIVCLIALIACIVASIVLWRLRPMDWKTKMAIILPLIPLMLLMVIKSYFSIIQFVNIR